MLEGSKSFSALSVIILYIALMKFSKLTSKFDKKIIAIYLKCSGQDLNCQPEQVILKSPNLHTKQKPIEIGLRRLFHNFSHVLKQYSHPHIYIEMVFLCWNHSSLKCPFKVIPIKIWRAIYSHLFYAKMSFKVLIKLILGFSVWLSKIMWVHYKVILHKRSSLSLPGNRFLPADLWWRKRKKLL